MRISIRFICADLHIPSGKHAIDLSDGSTVQDALAAYIGLYPIDDPHGKLLESMFLIGKHPAQLHTQLRDGDELMVMRTLYGG
jgi:hypothetical protein